MTGVQTCALPISKSGGTTSHTVSLQFPTSNGYIYCKVNESDSSGTIGNRNTSFSLTTLSNTGGVITGALGATNQVNYVSANGNIKTSSNCYFNPTYSLSTSITTPYTIFAGSYMSIYPVIAANNYVGSWS